MLQNKESVITNGASSALGKDNSLPTQYLLYGQALIGLSIKNANLKYLNKPQAFVRGWREMI